MIGPERDIPRDEMGKELVVGWETVEFGHKDVFDPIQSNLGCE